MAEDKRLEQPLSSAEIDKLREMEAKATKGPWEYQPDPDIVGHKEPDVLRFGERYLFVTAPMQYLPERDWRFIAAMRNTLPRLLAALSAYQRVADAAYAQYVDISTGVFGMTKLSELTKSLRDCGYEV